MCVTNSAQGRLLVGRDTQPCRSSTLGQCRALNKNTWASSSGKILLWRSSLCKQCSVWTDGAGWPSGALQQQSYPSPARACCRENPSNEKQLELTGPCRSPSSSAAAPAARVWRGWLWQDANSQAAGTASPRQPILLPDPMQRSSEELG